MSTQRTRALPKSDFPCYPPPPGKVWYTSTEGYTLPVSALQREIALRNLGKHQQPPGVR